ncbi:hypothetical protein [Natronoglycomyces albus]|nr:hypothetical protein [Natronoglycomyces albus]
MRTGRGHKAANIAFDQAQALTQLAATPDILSVQGSLLLKAAIAAATTGESQSANSYLSAASTTAKQLGRDGNHCWTGFGPTNVALHRVHVAAELGDLDEAVAMAQAVKIHNVKLPDWRARFAIDVAAAHAGVGSFEDSLTYLHLAESTAPQELTAIKSVSLTVDSVINNGTDRLRRQAKELSERLEQSA